MTQPVDDAAESAQPSSDDFLITTEMDENGNLTSSRLKIQDMPSSLLFYFGGNGNDRAMAELANRLVAEMAEKAEKAT